jgi:hypothetical protein
VQRRIVGFHEDARGEWVAELECGHERHVRHRPPFEQRPWVLDAERRRARLGSSIDCGLCEQQARGGAAR